MRLQLEHTYHISKLVLRSLPKLCQHRTSRKYMEAWYTALDQLVPYQQTQYVKLEPEDAKWLVSVGFLKKSLRPDKHILPKTVAFMTLEPTIESLMGLNEADLSILESYQHRYPNRNRRYWERFTEMFPKANIDLRGEDA